MLGFQVELEFLYVPSVRFVWSKKKIWSFFITIALIEIQCETILKWLNIFWADWTIIDWRNPDSTCIEIGDT